MRAASRTVIDQESISGMKMEPSRRAYQRRLGDVFGGAAEYDAAFARAARDGGAVFVVYPDIAAIRQLVVPAPAQAQTYALADEHHYPGFAGGLALRRFAARAER